MLGDTLAKLREVKKLTQQQVAEKIHISRATYAQYEIDRRVPEYLTLEKLADFFEVSIDYLVGREEPKKPILSDLELSDDELISKYNVVLDGKPIEEAILREILSYVRVRRSTK